MYGKLCTDPRDPRTIAFQSQLKIHTKGGGSAVRGLHEVRIAWHNSRRLLGQELKATRKVGQPCTVVHPEVSGPRSILLGKCLARFFQGDEQKRLAPDEERGI